MNRLILTLLAIVTLIAVGMLQPPDVIITVEAPNEVVAGNEFEVNVTLNKGDIESFSRFQMDLPAGLNVTPKLTANADFSFSDKKVRFIWLRLPAKEQISFSYKIKVDERLKGTFTTSGNLSYIYNNERMTASGSSHSISILPSPDVDPNLIVDVSEFEEKVIQFVPSSADGSQNVACIRQNPVLNEVGSEYVVTLLVNKEEKKKFAKIEETIPANYTAVAVDAKDGIFTFKNNVAKFLWMNLPSESQFLVSYRLIPINNSPLSKPGIKGKFSFLVNEKTIVTEVLQTDQNLEALSQDEIVKFIAAAKTKTTTEVPLYANVALNEDKQIKTSANNKKTYKKTGVKTNLQTSSYLLKPETGIYYRIQLAAGHKKVDVRKYFNKFHLEMDVKKEEHDGWLKYSVGSFKEYKEARDYRVHIWNTTPISDAFVSAYNDGQRITVQEALMIVDQRWYK